MQSSQEHLKTTVYSIFLWSRRKGKQSVLWGFRKQRTGTRAKVDSGPAHMYLHILENSFFSLISLSSRHRKHTFSKMVPRMDILVVRTNLVARRTKTEVLECVDEVKFYQSGIGWSGASLPLFPSHRHPRAFDLFSLSSISLRHN